MEQTEKGYLVYKCRTCNKHFAIPVEELDYSEEEAKYITCPHHGKHKDIVVVGAYDDICDCFQNKKDIYRRVNGKVHQIGWEKKD